MKEIIIIFLVAINIMFFLYYIKSFENFTDKIFLQLQDDQTYKIFWPDIINKGNDDPKNFFYKYLVWKGSFSSHPKTIPDQSGITKTPFFILNSNLNNNDTITVILTANDSFGSSNEAIKILSLDIPPIPINPKPILYSKDYKRC